MEAHLVSEGLRKIASLAQFVCNGTIAKRGFLFWDEPEAHLNPHLVQTVIEFLRELAKAGVQGFLASHDYLLTQRLSLAAEADVKLPIQFFGFARQPKHGVQVASSRTLAELETNPILDEFAQYYDDQRAMFNGADRP